MSRFFLSHVRNICLGLVSLAFLASGALAQSTVTVIGPVTPGDCAAFNSTTVIKDSGGTGCTGSGAGVPGGTNGQIQYNNSGNFGGFTANGDATINTATGAVTLSAVTNAKLAQMPADTVKCNPTGSTANAQDCTNPVISGVTINTTATGTSSFPGPGINENIVGPTSSTAVTSNVFYNQTLITNGANATNGNPVAGYYTALTSGGANANSSIYGEWIDVMHTTASVQNGDHVGSVPRCILSAAVTGIGGCFGAAPAAWVQSGGSMNATNGEATGMECDSRIDAGGSAAWHFGCGAISNGAVHGTLLDGAFEVGSAVAGGEWKNALILNSSHGASALATTGCVICTDGIAKTIASGIDLSAYSVTNTFIAGPGDKFVVDPSGNVTAANLTVPWTVYTATVTPGAGSVTQSSDSTVLQAGKWVRTEIHVTVSNIGTGTGTISINLPVAVKHAGETCIGRESAVSGHVISGSVGTAATTAMQVLNYDNTAPPFSNGVIYNFTCSYEAN